VRRSGRPRRKLIASRSGEAHRRDGAPKRAAVGKGATPSVAHEPHHHRWQADQHTDRARELDGTPQAKEQRWNDHLTTGDAEQTAADPNGNAQQDPATALPQRNENKANWLLRENPLDNQRATDRHQQNEQQARQTSGREAAGEGRTDERADHPTDDRNRDDRPNGPQRTDRQCGRASPQGNGESDEADRTVMRDRLAWRGAKRTDQDGQPN
jgi:hypothetical protein